MSEILAKKNDLVAFRAAIRDWLKKVCPSADFIDEMEEAAGKDYAKYEKYQRDWMAELTKVGLAVPHWPEEYGGASLSLKHLVIVSDEMARAGAPRLNMYVISLNHIPATLLAWANDKQKAKYLPGVSKEGTPWCQGFSEPGAGSDLASLRTKAELVGNEYVINGQKIWSSQSKHAQHCILLARTDTNVKKQAGITYFLMDMKAPGVEVRPIKQSTGRAEFSELFLTDVRIPIEDRLHPGVRGWRALPLSSRKFLPEGAGRGRALAEGRPAPARVHAHPVAPAGGAWPDPRTAAEQRARSEQQEHFAIHHQVCRDVAGAGVLRVPDPCQGCPGAVHGNRSGRQGRGARQPAAGIRGFVRPHHRRRHQRDHAQHDLRARTGHAEGLKRLTAV
jgi:hypothetical protein